MNLFSRYIEVNVYGNNVSETLGALTTINSNALDIHFDVTKTNSSENNKGEVHVYNLSEDTIGFLMSSRGGSLELKAGYIGEDSVRTIYAGDIVDIKKDRDGGDILTVITLATSLTATRSYSQSKSWGANTTLSEVLSYVSVFTGINVKQPKRFTEFTWKRGTCLAGNILESFKTLLTNIGYHFTITDNVIDIWDDRATVKYDVVVLNSETGLVGIPEAVSEINQDQVIKGDSKKSATTNVSDKDNSNKTLASIGYKVKSLINGSITPNARIRLTSNAVKADNLELEIDSVRHIGSSFSNDYYSEATCFEVETYYL